LERRNVPILIAGIIKVTMNIIANICNNDSFCKGCIIEDAKFMMNKNKYEGINNGWNTNVMMYANLSLTTILFLVLPPVY